MAKGKLAVQGPEPENKAALNAVDAAAKVAYDAIRSLVAITLQARDVTAENGNKPADLIGLYRRIYNADEMLTDVMKVVGGIKDSIKNHALPEVYERDGISTLTTAERDRVNMSTRVLASILAEDRQEVFRWLRETGNGSIIQETVNAGTLSSWVKNELEAARPIHPKVKYEITEVASLTRGEKPAIKKVG